MRFSTRGRYGVKAMYVLAKQYGQGPIPLKQVAEDQALSEPYLEQLIGELRKAGLVRSVRGAQGGYLLGRTPDEITIGDIIRVLEGPIQPADCVVDGDEDPSDLCDQAQKCVTRLIWERVQKSITTVLDGMSLADMLTEASEIDGDAQQCQTNIP